VLAAGDPGSAGEAYNVHDDDLPTASAYLREYKKRVKRIRSVSLPYFVTRMLARSLEAYHRRSQGQLPAILTPYKVASAGRATGSATQSCTPWVATIGCNAGCDGETFEYFATTRCQEA